MILNINYTWKPAYISKVALPLKSLLFTKTPFPIITPFNCNVGSAELNIAYD